MLVSTSTLTSTSSTSSTTTTTTTTTITTLESDSDSCVLNNILLMIPCFDACEKRVKFPSVVCS